MAKSKLKKVPKGSGVVMQAPEGVSQATVAGTSYEPDSDNFIDADPAHVEALKSHGFTVAIAKEEAEEA